MAEPYESYHYLPVDDGATYWGTYVRSANRGRIPSRDVCPPTGDPLLYQVNWKRGRTLAEFQTVRTERK